MCLNDCVPGKPAPAERTEGAVEGEAQDGAGFQVTKEGSNMNGISERNSEARASGSRGMDTRILVCDDEAQVREVISSLLEMAGYHVETATDGVAALEMIHEDSDRFKLVLTDHKMPQLDGLGLVRELRHGAFSGKIMVMSGSLDHAATAAYAGLAVDGLMLKPFDFAAFLKMISGLVPHPTC